MCTYIVCIYIVYWLHVFLYNIYMLTKYIYVCLYSLEYDNISKYPNPSLLYYLSLPSSIYPSPPSIPPSLSSPILRRKPKVQEKNRKYKTHNSFFPLLFSFIFFCSSTRFSRFLQFCLAFGFHLGKYINMKSQQSNCYKTF